MAIKRSWFQDEFEAKKFSELVEGNVYDADFIGGSIVQYPSDVVLKRYVFEEYRDKAGTGSEKIFADKDKAAGFAKSEWLRLASSDKEAYIKDPAGVFHVYEIELTAAEMGVYLEGAPNFTLSDFQTDEVWASCKKQPQLHNHAINQKDDFIYNGGSSFFVLGRALNDFSGKEDLLLMRMSDRHAIIAHGWDEKTKEWDYGKYYGTSLESMIKAISDFTSSHDNTLSIMAEVVNSESLEEDLNSLHEGLEI